MSGKVNPLEKNSDKRGRKSAMFTEKGEKSQSSSRFKITGSSSEQHYESEFLVTMSIVVRRKYKEIWYLFKTVNSPHPNQSK